MKRKDMYKITIATFLLVFGLGFGIYYTFQENQINYILSLLGVAIALILYIDVFSRQETNYY